MIEAVIFDVDGTLVDSVGMHARCWREAFLHFDKDYSVEQIRTQIGKGGDQLLPVFLSEHEVQKFGKELKEWRSAHWKRDYLPRVKPFPRVPELLQQLRRDGKRIALATSAKPDELEEYVRIAGIEGLVDEEASSGDAEQSKPHPDIFIAALGRLGNPVPANVVVVADTPWDAIAAERAGLRAIGLRTGGWSEEDLRKAGFIAVYASPQDLLASLASSPLGAP